MGWTHHWERGWVLSKEAFARAADGCRKLFDALDIELAAIEGDGDPVVTGDKILFNGAGDLCCEPFCIERMELPRHGRDRVFGHCETEHLPYDICVQAALIILKHHLDEAIIITSDGTDEDWRKAREVCQGRLGYGHEFRLDPSG